MGYKRLYIKIYTKKDSGIMASVTVPHTFTNGYAADANEVNANFAALKAFVDASLVQTDGSQVNAATSITKAMLVAAVQESIAPAGSILLYGGSSAPAGWLLCNGATLSTTTYAALFAVVGYTYGGSGGNFLLPSMTNKFAFGGTPGVGGGSTTIAEANLPSHTHTNTASFAGSSGQSTSNTAVIHNHQQAAGIATQTLNLLMGGPASITVIDPYGSYNPYTQNNIDIFGHSHGFTAAGTVAVTINPTGSGTAYYQPHVVFNYIIKS